MQSAGGPQTWKEFHGRPDRFGAAEKGLYALRPRAKLKKGSRRAGGGPLPDRKPPSMIRGGNP
jgi:hypothetical protein